MTENMVAPRLGEWGCTFTGRQFWPMDPRPEDIFAVDIAHALSMQCRFGGHCREFYSVAQHSVLVSQVCDPADALWGLLHDAAEAYLVDLPRPVKLCIPEYRRMEGRMLAAICTRYNLAPVVPESVQVADEAVLAAEAHQLMPAESVARWYLPIPAAEIRIRPWSPAVARQEFMLRLAELTS